MQGNRSRDTRPELAVRRAVHSLGLRYRLGVRPIPTLNRRADLVFTKQRIAVFVDGCYWHGCPLHSHSIQSNVEYWSAKLKRNVERDLDTTAQLEVAGWVVLRSWEHEDPAAVANRVRDAVGRRKDLDLGQKRLTQFRASSGGTAFPICRYLLDDRPQKFIFLPKDCSSAVSSTVSRRAPSTSPLRGCSPRSRRAW